MKAGVLFSGGKDSALAALMLSRDYVVELNTFVFSPEREIPGVAAAADVLGLPLVKRVFEDGLLDEVVDMILRCGYPADAINMVHRKAVISLCREYRVVGDGTRFNDRVPVLARDEVQQIGDLYGCSYLRPLLGYVKPEVKRLAARMLEVVYGETGMIENGDYEHEIRSGISSRGIDPAAYFPPDHEQSLVIGVKGQINRWNTPLL